MGSSSSGCNQVRLYTFLKTCLLVYNFIFLLFGFGILGLGIYSEVMRQELTEMDHVFVTPSVFLFCLGAVVALFASIGFIGALRDNLCLLRILTVSIVICLLAELGAGIAALVYKDPAKDFVNKYVLKGLVTYYDDHDLKNVVDFIQEEFTCCGGRYYKDWKVNPYHNCSAPGPSACGVPYSCCVINPDDDIIYNSMCGYDTMNIPAFEAADIINLTGCIDSVLDYIWGHLDVFAGVLLGIFIPQALGIILGLLYIDILKQIIASIRKNPAEPTLLSDHKV